MLRVVLVFCEVTTIVDKVTSGAGLLIKLQVVENQLQLMQGTNMKVTSGAGLLIGLQGIKVKVVQE